MVICPRCHGTLAGTTCIHCGADYAGPLGIVDLRKGAPIRETTQELLERAESETLGELLARRAARNEGLPRRIVKLSNWYTDTAAERSERMMTMFSSAVKSETGVPLGGGVAMDLGCGLGAGLGALAKRFDRVVGVDLSLENLALAACRVREQALDNVTLVHTGGDSLPIADESLDAVVALNVLEHLVDYLDDTLKEVHRVLRPAGMFCADSRNRYDLFFREPHVQLRFVGYLPRPLQVPYVRWRSGRPYASVRLLSARETWRKVAAHVGPARVRMSRPSAWGKAPQADRVVDAVDRLPVVGSLARAVYPSVVVVARRR